MPRSVEAVQAAPGCSRSVGAFALRPSRGRVAAPATEASGTRRARPENPLQALENARFWLGVAMARGPADPHYLAQPRLADSLSRAPAVARLNCRLLACPATRETAPAHRARPENPPQPSEKAQFWRGFAMARGPADPQYLEPPVADSVSRAPAVARSNRRLLARPRRGKPRRRIALARKIHCKRLKRLKSGSGFACRRAQ